MKRTIVSVSAIALLAGVLSLTRDAWSEPGSDEGASVSTPHKVGLIDMAHVFKHYKKFEVLREDLKIKIAKSEEDAKALQQEMVDLQKKIKEFGEGTPDFTKTEQTFVQKAADFESFKRQKSREFLKEESQIYLQIYNEVQSAVKFYSEKNKYTLIMRFNKEDLENENPQQMLQNMNRQVVFHRDEDDITQTILNMLNNRFDSKKNKSAPASKTGEPGPKKEAKGGNLEKKSQ